MDMAAIVVLDGSWRPNNELSFVLSITVIISLHKTTRGFRHIAFHIQRYALWTLGSSEMFNGKASQ